MSASDIPTLGTRAHRLSPRPLSCVRLPSHIKLLADLGQAERPTNLAAAFAAGIVDQSAYYRHRDGARTYGGAISDRRYRNSVESQEAVAHLFQTSQWLHLIDEQPFGSVIDLGVGTGDKIVDLVLQFRRAQPSMPLQILGVDIARPMLNAAIPYIENVLENRLSVAGARCDFTQELPTLCAHPTVKRWLDCVSGRRLFTILGGTMGNFSTESTCLKSLRDATRPGDVVVIGLEFASLETGLRQTDAAMIEEYQNDNYAHFVYAGVQEFFSGDFENFKGVLSVKMGGPYSELSYAQSITTSVAFEGRRVKLLHSNRHDLNDLRSFVETFGFTLRAEGLTARNPFYRCLAFERTEAGHNPTHSANAAHRSRSPTASSPRPPSNWET